MEQSVGPLTRLPLGGRARRFARMLGAGRGRRLVRMLAAGWDRAPRGLRPLPGPYFLPSGYRSRERPAYDYEHRDDGIVYQPNVYADAARIAERLGSPRIIDVGCGNGEKLVALYPRFEIVGIDHGENLLRCRERFPFGTWLEHDLDSAKPLPLSDDVAGSVLICADVIEHLRYPERLLRNLRVALGRAHATLISTPERDLTWGTGHMGPPPNPAHVREWALNEFAALLAAHSFEQGFIGLTRSSNTRTLQNTILAVVFPDTRRLAAARDSLVG